MSKYEKITFILVTVFVIAILVFSYHEITEPEGSDHERGPNFQQSLGQDFEMGTFKTVLSQQSSGPIETNCRLLEPVIIGTLHNINVRLEKLGVYKPGTFEVNQQTLDLLCYQNASLTLSNYAGEKLLLVKFPFQRNVSPSGNPSDESTYVRINATVTIPGAVSPTNPTTYGEELIPDKYLDEMSE